MPVRSGSPRAEIFTRPQRHSPENNLVPEEEEEEGTSLPTECEPDTLLEERLNGQA